MGDRAVSIFVGHAHGGGDSDYAAGERAEQMNAFTILIAQITAFDDCVGDLSRFKVAKLSAFDPEHHAFPTNANNGACFLELQQSISKDGVEVTVRSRISVVSNSSRVARTDAHEIGFALHVSEVAP